MSSERIRNIAINAADAVALAFASIVLLASTPDVALAYVDPSVMTYTIQALAGVAVALSTVFGVAYRRLRKRAVRAFGIDENAGKVVDPDVTAMRGDALEAENARLAEFWRNAPKPGQAKKLSYLSRLWRALVVCLFACATLLLLAPMELVVANAHSLTYSLSAVWKPIVVNFFVVSIAMSLLVALIRGRAFDVACALIAVIGLAFWIQALFMNVDLPQANGEAISWLEYWPQHLFSAFVWIALIAVTVWYVRNNTKQMRPIITGICSMFFIVTLVGVASVFSDPQSLGKSRDDKEVFITEDGINTLSPHDNIVVFVLDMYDTKEYLRVVADRPHMMDEFTGFTFYQNATGSMIPTKYAVPYLLTGSWPQPDDEFAYYLDHRYQRSTFLQDLHAAGYDMGLYTDTMGMWDDWKDIAPLTINQHALNSDKSAQINWLGTSLIMAKVSLYRDAPWILKPLFWYYTDDINTDMTNKSTGLDSPPYLINDVRYHDKLAKEGLSIEDRGSKGSFRFIHLNGAHFPYVMNSSMHNVAQTSYEDQAEGAMNIVSDYLRQMKELGLYDDATIIVTSDHGVYRWGTEVPLETTTPIMFVKPAQSSELDAQPMTTSNAQTGHIDFSSTIMRAAAGDSSTYGEPCWNAPMEGRDRYFVFPDHDGKVDKKMTELKIVGDCLDIDNWSPTGVSWAASFWNEDAGKPMKE